MNLADALSLRVGDMVTHPETPVRYRPIRITELWTNAARTIVLLRLASIDSTAWLHATGYDLPPDGKVWDKVASEWITPGELAERKKGMRSGFAPA